jgi:hypothetical protein
MVTRTEPLEVLNPVSQVASQEGGSQRASREEFAGADSLDAWENFNSEFLDRGWGDGFPLVAPTPDRVGEFLAAVRRLELDPLDVIGKPLAPGNGIATVEKLAINCAMAGCRPEHLTVLISAVEAITETADPAFHADMRSPAGHFPMVLISGPIIKQLDINSGMCSLGPGKPSQVNTVIGRALRLILMNVGHAYPTDTDLDTIGVPQKYSYCLAENEDQNPWGEPLHVELGFRPEDSVVTVFSVSEAGHFGGYTADPERLLISLVKGMRHAGGDSLMPGAGDAAGDNYLIMYCPDHARSMAVGGETKASIRKYVLENVPLRSTDRVHFTVVGGPSSGSHVYHAIPSLTKVIN